MPEQQPGHLDGEQHGERRIALGLQAAEEVRRAPAGRGGECERDSHPMILSAAQRRRIDEITTACTVVRRHRARDRQRADRVRDLRAGVVDGVRCAGAGAGGGPGDGVAGGEAGSPPACPGRESPGSPFAWRRPTRGCLPPSGARRGCATPTATARVRGRSSRCGRAAGTAVASSGGTAGPFSTSSSDPMPPPPPTTDSAIAAAIAAGTRIATPEARSAWRIQDRTTKWTVAGCRRDTLRSVGRLSIARSMRVALLGLALVLAVVAGLGVAGLYSARQDYEDRLANGYGLQASGGPAARGRRRRRGVEARPRARRPSGRSRPSSRRRAGSRTATRVASSSWCARPVAGRRRARPRPHYRRARTSASPTRGAPRATTRRVAVAVIVAGGVLALLAALALVAALVARCGARSTSWSTPPARLAAGDLGARVREDGPWELRALGRVVQRDGGGPRVRRRAGSRASARGWTRRSGR